MKKIILNEEQVKRIIEQVISEQEMVSTQKITPESLPPIVIPYKFKSGFWMPTPELSQQVSTLLKPTIDFIQKHQNQKISITIEAGESQVTNADNEPTSKNKGKQVPQKYLATARANSIKNIIDDYFNTSIKSGLIKIKPEFTQPKIVIGSTKYTPQVSDPNDQSYLNEQYIKVIVNATGESVTTTTECLVNLQIMIDYRKAWCKMGVDESRCHQCDKSVYTVYLNGFPLKDSKGSNRVNLNNSTDGGDREFIGIVRSNDVKQILEGGKKEIVLTYQCELDDCHADSMHVTVTNKSGQQLFNDFVSGGVRGSKAEGQKILLKMDECGKKTFAAPPAKPKEEPKRTITKWTFKESDPVGSLAKIYATVDNEGNVHLDNLYDPVFDRAALKAYNNKPWTNFLSFYDGLLSKKQIKEIPAAAAALKNNQQTPVQN
jgi:hypothetical protein